MNEIHQTNREAECRRNHYGWGQLCYVSSLCYKLILIWLLGALELFMKSSEWRSPKELGTWQQGHPSTRRRDYTCPGVSPSVWPAPGERHQRKSAAGCPFLLSAQLILKGSSHSARGHLSQKLGSDTELRHRYRNGHWTASLYVLHGRYWCPWAWLIVWPLQPPLRGMTQLVYLVLGFTAACTWWIKGHGRNAGEKSGRRGGKQGECLGADTPMGKKR